MPAVNKPRQLVGVFLLVVVNVVLVASSEISKHLFKDLNFKRPFFMTYVKSCMFTIFLLRYAFHSSPKHSSKTSTGEASYTKLETNLSDEEYEVESLTAAEFESITSDLESEDLERLSTGDESTNNNIVSDLNTTNDLSAEVKLIPDFNSDTTYKCCDKNFDDTLTDTEISTVVNKDGEKLNGMSTPDNKRTLDESISQKISSSARRVRFSLFREVRRFPERNQRDAKLARLSYRPRMAHWTCRCRTVAKSAAVYTSNNGEMLDYCLYFAPLRFLSSIGYQLALLFASISSISYIGTLSSLFVLGFIGKSSWDRFSLLTFGFLLLNFGGVAIVTEFSAPFLGYTAAFSSAVCYGGYLLLFSYSTAKYGRIDLNLMFGVMGVFSVLVCTPLIFILHATGVERELPSPTAQQWAWVIVRGAMESLVADFLLLHATLLTNPLFASLSMSLAVPLSMVANAKFRGQAPDTAQVFASILILISFIALSFIRSSPTPHFSPSSQNHRQPSSSSSSCVSYFCDRCFGIRITTGSGASIDDDSSSSSASSSNSPNSAGGGESSTTELMPTAFGGGGAQRSHIRRDSSRVLVEIRRDGESLLYSDECAEDVRLMGENES